MAVTKVEACSICHRTRQEHRDAEFIHHAFNTEGRLIAVKPVGSQSPQSTSAPPQGSAGTPMSGDPVLRMALIRNGAVTLAELDKIEAELKTIGIIYDNADARTSGKDNPDRAEEFSQRSLWDIHDSGTT